VTAAPPTGRSGVGRRPFELLWAANIVSPVGDGAYGATAPLLVAALTRNLMAVVPALGDGVDAGIDLHPAGGLGALAEQPGGTFQFVGKDRAVV
jgi:hypothetical protein